jgi:two-component system response regulator AtoC
MKILVVDDDRVTLNLLKEFLEQHHFEVLLAEGADSALEVCKKEAAKNSSIQLVLSDIRMEDSTGFGLLADLKKINAQIVMILMTGFGSMDGAIEAIQKGAFDYISKPFDLKKLLALVQKATRQVEEVQKNKPLDNANVQPMQTPKTLMGRSPKIIEVYKTVARATLSSSTVLISGESGTGKELVARAIHDHSPRKTKKFVAVNCGALTETLLESELFGHVKGSFTGAHVDKVGLFEEAQGGTLFLDEIGDVTLGLQVKLLRVLQESEVRRVGGNSVQKIDVRIVAATHRNLENRVREGLFREDLYYRLKVIEIELPPLRERSEDIPDLANYFLRKFATQLGKRISAISDDGLKALQTFNWPGNVRELEHQVERAVALSSSSVLSADDFDLAITDTKNSTAADHENNESPTAKSLESLEKTHILKVLKEVDYNKSKASDVLGIDRATLYRKAQKYGIALKGD